MDSVVTAEPLAKVVVDEDASDGPVFQVVVLDQLDVARQSVSVREFFGAEVTCNDSVAVSAPPVVGIAGEHFERSKVMSERFSEPLLGWTSIVVVDA
jgi:hypothetical protein